MTSKKSNVPAFATLKRAAFETLKREYAEQIADEIKKAGGATKLATALGMSGHYVRMIYFRNKIVPLKNCVELIAQKLYGWKPEKGEK